MVDGEHARLAEQVGDLGREAVGRDERGVAVQRRDDVDPVDPERGVADQRAERERAERAENRREPAPGEDHERKQHRDRGLDERPRHDRGARRGVPARARVKLTAAIISSSMIRSLWAPPSP